MAAPKGHERYGGREKGQENNLTKTARQLFVQTLEKQVPSIEKAFEDVKKKDPAKYLELFAKYAQYFVPKKIDQETTLKVESPIIIDWKDNPNE